MASTAPKTDFAAGDGLTYTQINALEENVRMLQGGDATLPLSTDAATAGALAKRDANGDIAFRDIAAQDIAAQDIAAQDIAARNVAVSGEIVWPIDIEHDKGGVSTGDSMAPITRRIYIKRSCTITTKFTGVDLAGTVAEARIYKNGVAIGTNRNTNNTFTETFSAIPGDYFEVWGHGRSYSGTYYPAVISNFLVSSGSTVFI